MSSRSRDQHTEQFLDERPVADNENAFGFLRLGEAFDFAPGILRGVFRIQKS